MGVQRDTPYQALFLAQGTGLAAASISTYRNQWSAHYVVLQSTVQKGAEVNSKIKFKTLHKICQLHYFSVKHGWV